ncbi:MAG: hypothetical protein WCP77_17305, partial [Roseococcus sp.]
MEPGKNGKMRKVPYLNLTWRASTNRPECWLHFEAADSLAATFQEMGFQAGIGLLLGPLPGGIEWLACIDLDACRNAETEELEPWASEVLHHFCNTFAENSPSGRGAHSLFITTEADIAAAGLMKNGKVPARIPWKRPAPEGEKSSAIEILLDGYVTITGSHLGSLPQRIGRISADDLRWVAQEAGPAFVGQASTGDSAETEESQAKTSASAAIGHNGGPPLRSAPTTKHIAQTAKSAVKHSSEPTFRFSPTRMARLACQLDDSEFQFLACLWHHGRSAKGEM